MKKILIIEDIKPNFDWLQKLILAYYHDQVEIMGPLKSIKEVNRVLSEEPLPNLIFSDIRLTDGLVFDALSTLENVCVPIIFTTAFSEYSIKSFQYNSIDYLLKPIEQDMLNKALRKYEQLQQSTQHLSLANISQISTQSYRQRFICTYKEFQIIVMASDVSHFTIDCGILYLHDSDNKKYRLDINNMDMLEEQLNPEVFFRVNRQCIVNLHYVKAFSSTLVINAKLILKNTDDPIPISRRRIPAFRKWING